MEPSRIKAPGLAATVDAGQLEWNATVSPITTHFAARVAGKDFRGKRVAYWGHITRQNIFAMAPALAQTGAEIVMGACNVDSTDDVAAAYAASLGIGVYGWQGMSQEDYRENLAIVRDFGADYLCDMGGELIEACLDRFPAVRCALEATTSGLTRLKRYSLPFPVFDWNTIPLKDLHNRFHVGDTVWPAFNHVTGLSLYGRHVLVIGFGPVGKGIAERARALGGLVCVCDLDPVRLLEARHFGCEPVSLEEGLSRCTLIVTATGFENVLTRDALRRVRPGTILFNAGHSNREIEIDWLNTQPHRRMKAHIERYDLGETHLFLLGQGSLLNLSAGAGPFGIDQFDHYSAVMLLGITWMLEGGAEGYGAGLQRFPFELEREIAAVSAGMVY